VAAMVVKMGDQSHADNFLEKKDHQEEEPVEGAEEHVKTKLDKVKARGDWLKQWFDRLLIRCQNVETVDTTSSRSSFMSALGFSGVTGAAMSALTTEPQDVPVWEYYEGNPTNTTEKDATTTKTYQLMCGGMFIAREGTGSGSAQLLQDPPPKTSHFIMHASEPTPDSESTAPRVRFELKDHKGCYLAFKDHVLALVLDPDLENTGKVGSWFAGALTAKLMCSESREDPSKQFWRSTEFSLVQDPQDNQTPSFAFTHSNECSGSSLKTLIADNDGTVRMEYAFKLNVPKAEAAEEAEVVTELETDSK